MAMFDFLKSSTDKRLDEIVERLKLNYSNNYKEDTQRIYQEFTNAFENLKLANKLSNKQIEHYDEIAADYAKKIEKFNNSDRQKAFW